MHAFSAQDALVALMVLTAAADGEMTEAENRAISATISRLPVFEGFDERRLGDMSAVVVEMLQEEDGVDQALRLIGDSLPGQLRETAYSLACEVAAADQRLAQEEIRLLELIRHALAVERLAAAALERAARARYATA